MNRIHGKQKNTRLCAHLNYRLPCFTIAQAKKFMTQSYFRSLLVSNWAHNFEKGWITWHWSIAQWKCVEGYVYTVPVEILTGWKFVRLGILFTRNQPYRTKIPYMSKIDDLIRAVNQVLPSVQLLKLICMQSNDINIHKQTWIKL